MKKRLTAMLPFLAALAVDFYLLPFLARNTGAAMLLMLAVMPLAAFGTGLVYGLRNGFSILLPAAAAILFIPAIFLHYNSSAWVYAVFYGGIVLAGDGLGSVFYQKR